MKYSSVLFGLVGAIAVVIPATAQENYPASPSQGRSIDFLTPEPLSVRRPGAATPDATLTRTNKLNDVVNSIQPRANKSPKSPLTGIGIPEDLIRTSPQRSRDEDPLGFFQVSPPAPSLGVNLRTD